jgi:phage tail-like protein
MPAYYPPASFHFTVAFADPIGMTESSFAEVSGLDAERAIGEIKEGGENRFAHRVPERAKYANLVLKRGVLLGGSRLAAWCKGILEGDLGTPIVPQDIDVFLLDPEGAPLMSWNFKRAWPTKWSVAPLNADKSELAVETLELAYAYFTTA